ncbi:MAG: DUF5522 domain-containing protein [Acidimicrobiia bacterium]
MGAALRTGWLERPDPARFPPDTVWYGATLAAHDTAVARGDAGYLDPRTGLFVLTAAELAARGTCCDSGCRHCPYVGAIDNAP